MAKKAKKIDWAALKEKVRATDREVLKKVAGSIDGWTIFEPQKFLDLGLGADIVQAHTREIKSDARDPKSTIYTDGKPVRSLTGVYGLSLLEFIAAAFGVTSWKNGRGFRAGHLTEQLLEKFAAEGK